MASAVARASSEGLCGYATSGVQGQAPGLGIRGRSPPEAESYLKIK